MERATRRIVLDFDGVLHDHRKLTWEGPTVIKGPPFEGAAKFVRWLVSVGIRPIIVSSRLCQNPNDDCYEAGDPVEVTAAIRKWLDAHGMQGAEIFNPAYGKPGADLYIDDKGYRFEGRFPYKFVLEGLYVGELWPEIAAAKKAIAERKVNGSNAVAR